VLISFGLKAQTFELTGQLESYKGHIGDIIKAPVKFKNISEKPVTLIIRKVNDQIGTTQKNYFCVDNACLDQKIEDYIVKVDPGQTLSSFHIALEAGLAPGVSSVKYIAYNKSNPGETLEFELHFVVDEKPEKHNIYHSRIITVQELYPNPLTDVGYMDYKITSDRVKAKIVIHNILGNPVGEYDLPAYESKVKIRTDELNAGIYFYTLYLDNEGVMTRKLIVRK
jgi:hypothetical protein